MMRFASIALTATLLFPAIVRGQEVDLAPSARSGQWGLVNIPAACVRALPSHSAELSTQAVCGTPLRLTGKDGEWWTVELPDGYAGYVNQSSLVELDSINFDEWLNADRIVITATGVTPLLTDTLHADESDASIAPLVGGSILRSSSTNPGSRYFEASLPDGRKGYISTEAAMPIEEWAAMPFSPQLALSTARAMMGASYLWGGTTSLAPDCSGLVKCAWLANAIIVPRDASQQALAGIDIPANHPEVWMPADLLFFTNAEGTRITHVGIYDKNGAFIHSSGRVRPGHIDPAHPDSDGRRVAKVSRYAGCESTPGIVRVANHPWYFSHE